MWTKTPWPSLNKKHSDPNLESIEDEQHAEDIMSRRIPRPLRQFAQSLRKEQTDAERCLWARLRSRRLGGKKYRRQHAIPPYVADFFCGEANLVIEVDGGQHGKVKRRGEANLVIEVDGGQHWKVKRRDEARTAFLEKEGLRVIRFWNHDVLTSTDAVLEVIERELKRI